MLDLLEDRHDLSRRVNLYHLPGMSFREYLSFSTGLELPLISLEKLIEEPRNFAYLGQIDKVLGHFKTYLESGYYPFPLEDSYTHYERISQIVNKIIFEDIPNSFDLKTVNLHIFKKILGFLASIPPGEINSNNIARNIGMAHQIVDHYLNILESVGLIN